MLLGAPLLLLAFSSVRAATVVAPAAQATQHITLDIVNGPVSPDGFTRIGVLANGTFPGPPIVATKGQTLVVTVNNKLTDPTMRRSTTLDFDGVFFNSANVFDEGSPFVTNCPFGPGESYTYSKYFSDCLFSGDQTGSFWYHSQLSVQYADGLRGTLIIYDPEDPLQHLYDVDDASTVPDWHHNSSVAGLASYIQTQVIPVADTGLFNAKGRYNGGPDVEFAAVSVTKGKRYRFRLINMSIRANFLVSIDNPDAHNLTDIVIETDGVATVPNTVDVLTIFPGQRYSIVAPIRRPDSEHSIDAVIDSGNPAHNLNLNATLSRGILRYEGAPNAEPKTPMTSGPTGPGTVALDEANLVPLVAEAAPEPDFNLTFNTFMPVGITTWQINNSSYIPPTVPTLVRVLQGQTQQMDFNQSENTFVFPANKTVQVTIIDAADEGHPFHLHGMNFWVVKPNSTDVVNTRNPIRRDVAITGLNDLVVRFRTDKPGPWFFHCHIFYHFAVGLGSVIGAGLDEAAKTIHPTEAWERLCPNYDALPPDEQ
ncbi:Cu-oxidase-domain-containing protein [Mycena pura]|uniref:Cu-oxidase-domain-containing protein n=1 Tax=Mycena pura TaxID=153505 RepID=A0AAD6VG31_9AGAR|nr:Cu-oxidase-domain-containing protein [Mycena pura]